MPPPRLSRALLPRGPAHCPQRGRAAPPSQRCDGPNALTGWGIWVQRRGPNGTQIAKSTPPETWQLKNVEGAGTPNFFASTRTLRPNTLSTRRFRGWGALPAILLAHCLILLPPSASVFGDAACQMSGMSAVQAARVTEVSVGITQYATEHTGFRGTLKYRCADFIVREVSLDRRVIKLTSTKATAEMPVDPSNPSTAVEAPPALEGAARTEVLAALIGQEQVRSFLPLDPTAPPSALRIPLHTTSLDRKQAWYPPLAVAPATGARPPAGISVPLNRWRERAIRRKQSSAWRRRATWTRPRYSNPSPTR